MAAGTITIDLHGMTCYQAQVAIDAALRRAGRAKICRFTAPPPDRISYLIAPRAVELPREAALFLEDLRWELQQHPDVVIYF